MTEKDGFTLHHTTLHLKLWNGITKEMGWNQWLFLSNVIDQVNVLNYISAHLSINTLLCTFLTHVSALLGHQDATPWKQINRLKMRKTKILKPLRKIAPSYLSLVPKHIFLYNLFTFICISKLCICICIKVLHRAGQMLLYYNAFQVLTW